MKCGALFAGYGGLELGVSSVLDDVEVAWYSEIDAGASTILAHRWPGVPNHGDVAAVEWADVEPVEILTGGFPCTDLSKVGRRLGLRPDTRSGLWAHMAYAIDQLRPRLVVAENVRGLLSGEASGDVEPCPFCLGDDPGGAMRALGAVLGDLAALGYDAAWTCIRASDVDAPHERERVFLVATDPDRDPFRPDARGARSTESRERRGRPSDHGPARRGAPGARGGAGATRVDVWRDYAATIEAWERVTGRDAPDPIDGDGRPSSRFAEWMMGLPAGWVTDVPGLSYTAQWHALGNGVVPQQAAAALRAML